MEEGKASNIGYSAYSWSLHLTTPWTAHLIRRMGVTSAKSCLPLDIPFLYHLLLRLVHYFLNQSYSSVYRLDHNQFHTNHHNYRTKCISYWILISVLCNGMMGHWKILREKESLRLSVERLAVDILFFQNCLGQLSSTIWICHRGLSQHPSTALGWMNWRDRTF